MDKRSRGNPGKPKPGSGRTPTPIDRRTPDATGKVIIRITQTAAAKLARLMLTTDAPTPEALIERMIDERMTTP